MANLFKVTLDTSVNPPVLMLDVAAGGSQFAMDQYPRLLVWYLAGNLATGNFVPISDPAPGFSWVLPFPPAGIFSSATVGRKGRLLWITNYYPDALGSGQWGYRLRVELAGVVYETVQPLIEVPTGPIIINH